MTRKNYLKAKRLIRRRIDTAPTEAERKAYAYCHWKLYEAQHPRRKGASHEARTPQDRPRDGA